MTCKSSQNAETPSTNIISEYGSAHASTQLPVELQRQTHSRDLCLKSTHTYPENSEAFYKAQLVLLLPDLYTADTALQGSVDLWLVELEAG